MSEVDVQERERIRQRIHHLPPDDRNNEEADRLRWFMCKNFFHVRAFGAVLSTGINAGQVRGPVQLIEPIVPQEITITRMAATNEAEKKRRTEGSEKGDDKHIVPYALYRAHGFVSAKIS
jgi:CRISPR-associated protein Csd2